MKGLLATILLILVFLTAIHFDFQQQHPEFESWKQLHQIDYETEAEQFYRRTIFYANLKKIAEHNARSGETYKMGVNQFTAFSEEEFKHRFLNLDLAQGQVKVESSEEVKAVIVDWVKEGAVGPVKNQGTCGNGVLYSTLGGVEGLSKVETGTLSIFSDQQLIDCVFGCSGSFAGQGYDYYKKHSVCTAAEYPYTGRAGTCQNKTCAFKISGYNLVKTCDQLTSAIMKQPVSVAVDATNWSTYSSGVFSKCGSALNHMVLLVGMADEYWKCKNSWGTVWGEQGYIRIARGNTCGICSYAAYPIK